MRKQNLVVLGTGSFGTALAALSARAGHRVTLWGRRLEQVEAIRRSGRNDAYLPETSMPEGLAYASGEDATFEKADAFIVTIPTQHLRATLTPLDRAIGRDRPVLSCAKGIENGSLQLASDVIREAVGRSPVTVLSGPGHAAEITRGLPASVVVASRDARQADYWQDVLNGETFRIYTSNDPIGVELGGALKNVIAIAAGMCDGLKLGDSAKAALLSRGIVEMARLGTALGARKQTFFGISGIGDLITTSYSPYGRNLKAGRDIGSGKTLAQILAGTKMVAEGVWTARAARDLGRQEGVELPIIDEVYHVLYRDRPPLEAVRRLMKRKPKSEASDLA